MRLVRLIVLLLLWPAWASAQIVTPGGGGVGTSGTITGGSCSNPQFMQAISTTGVPTCATPAGVAAPTGQYQTLQSDVSSNPIWNNFIGINEAPSSSYNLAISQGALIAAGVRVDQNTTNAQWAMQTSNAATAGQSGINLNAGGTTGTIAVGSNTYAGTYAGALYLSGGTSVAGVIVNAPTGGSVNLEVNNVSIANVSSSGLFLSTPLAAGQGGTGVTTVPASGTILVGQGSAYGNRTLSNDCTITNTGAITCTKTNNVAFTALATAAVPLSIANGGRGSTTAPSVGQIDVASSTTAFTPVTMSNDCTITSGGAITCTRSGGTLLTSLFAPLTNPTAGQNNYFPFVGTTAGGNATAGNVGEMLTAAGTSQSLTTATPLTLISISLTAGDWDVWGAVYFTGAGAGNVSQYVASISTIANNVCVACVGSAQMVMGSGTMAGWGTMVPMQRVNITATTTYYLSGQATFASLASSGTGSIFARRVR